MFRTLGNKKRIREQIRLVSESPHFDREWYLNNNSDIATSNKDPAEHYLKHGWKEGRNPSKTFSTSRYLHKHPNCQICPLLFEYYLKSPNLSKEFEKERMKIIQSLSNGDKYYNLLSKSKFFDKKWYLKTYPDIAHKNIDPINHYLSHGWKEGRNPGPKFSTNTYLKLNPDVKAAGINPLLHYIQNGQKEKRYYSERQIKIHYSLSYKLIKAWIYVLLSFQRLCFSRYFIHKTIDSIYAHAKHRLVFPYQKNPKVSIIIPVYNQYKYTIACLNSIQKYTHHIPYEIIIADDNSTDETINLSKYIKNITIIRNRDNQGFLKNCNKAVKSARGSYILLLNNDMLVTRNWLKYLLETIQSDPSIGVVGGSLITPQQNLQECGRTMLCNGFSFNKYRGKSIDSCIQRPFPVHYCSGCLLLIKKSLWTKLNGFDTRFSPAYYEDTDFCMSVRVKLKKKVMCDPRSRVIHFHNVSYHAKSDRLSYNNRLKFIDKWKNELTKSLYDIPYTSDDISLIERSGLFDTDFYAKKYGIKSNAIQHYLSRGWVNEYNPSELFDTHYYLNQYYDVECSGVNPLIHFLKKEKKEGRTKNDLEISPVLDDLKNHLQKMQLEKKKKKILLISHSFSLSGAPLAVLNTAKFFKEKGWLVTVVGFDKRELLDEYSKLGIPVFSGKCYTYINMGWQKLLSQFDFFFANTIISHHWVRIFPHNRYIWRIAEGEDIFTKYNTPKLIHTLMQSQHIYAVSKYTQGILSTVNPNVNLLLYGIPDHKIIREHPKDDRIVRYMVIGNNSYRKGQDIVLKALKNMHPDDLKHIEIQFMGTDFQQYVSTKTAKFLGVKVGEEKYKLLAQADILLCSSRDDPNPQVVMEGMMMHKPCIVTDKTGQKDYITNGSDGWIISADDVQSMQDILHKTCHLDKALLEKMGNESYKLYQKYFSQEKYLDTVFKIATGAK